MAQSAILNASHWDVQYRNQELPWDTGRPSTELQRVFSTFSQRPARAVELGCGTGINALWLAQQGVDVTAIDLSAAAIQRAFRRAARAQVVVRFLTGNLLDPGKLQGPYDFFFDRGCYHAVRLADVEGYHHILERITRPGTLGLVLMGNANEPEDKVGPPVVDRATIYREWSPRYDILQLHSMRFDPVNEGERRYLGWSCLLRRRARQSAGVSSGWGTSR